VLVVRPVYSVSAADEVSLRQKPRFSYS
jgi:hypothetical protein